MSMDQKFKKPDIRIIRLIFIAIVFMSTGLVFELYLLDHYEGLLQLIPFLCIGIGLILAILLFKFKNRVAQLSFQLCLLLTALSGIVGIFLHLNANAEFEKEIKPSIEGMDLILESLSGALPSLAPGSLILFSLIGYSYLLLIKQKA